MNFEFDYVEDLDVKAPTIKRETVYVEQVELGDINAKFCANELSLVQFANTIADRLEALNHNYLFKGCITQLRMNPMDFEAALDNLYKIADANAIKTTFAPVELAPAFELEPMPDLKYPEWYVDNSVC